MIETLFYTVQEAATALRSSRSQVYLLLATGQLRSVKVGRNRRVPASALREYAERLITEQAS